MPFLLGTDEEQPGVCAEIRKPKFGTLACLILGIAVAAPGSAYAGGTVSEEFDPANFPAVPLIDNAFFPKVPGTIYTYKAEGEDGCEWSVIDVTSSTRVVAGVTTRVVHEDAYEDEDCGGPVDADKVERTDDWFAQDSAGHVWYLGEHSEDWNEDTAAWELSDGSWEAGVDGAEAGIIMLANPLPGQQYYQEFYEDFAEDEARVLRKNVWLSLYDSDVFDHDLHNCLVTKEWTRLSPGEVEHKYYCPNVGLVAIEELKGRTLRFELVGLVPAP